MNKYYRLASNLHKLQPVIQKAQFTEIVITDRNVKAQQPLSPEKSKSSFYISDIFHSDPVLVFDIVVCFPGFNDFNCVRQRDLRVRYY